ncbi:hypothetical protein AgCh_035685 [Apium graveolens]
MVSVIKAEMAPSSPASKAVNGYREPKQGVLPRLLSDGRPRSSDPANTRDFSPTSSAKLNAAPRAPRSSSGTVPKLSPIIQRVTAAKDWEFLIVQARTRFQSGLVIVKEPHLHRESEESGAAETKSSKSKKSDELDDKSGKNVQKLSPLLLPPRKTKVASQEDLGDGVHNGYEELLATANAVSNPDLSMASTNSLEYAMNNISLEDEEEGGLSIEPETLVEDHHIDNGFNAKLCVVARFLSDGRIDFSAMQQTMATLWIPGRGVYMKELKMNLYMFQFYHEEDV